MGSAGRSPQGDTRRRVRALPDAALVDAMRGGDPAAWAEFEQRFRPLLEHYATRTGIPRWEWDQCIDEVLEDEMLRIATPGAPAPASLAGYLVRAVRHRHLKVKRSALRRARHYDEAAASSPGVGEPVVRYLASQDALRASAGPDAEGTGAEAATHEPHAVARLASLLASRLGDQELRLLAWVGEDVPRRQIAEWLGDGYEATRKRIQRLAARVRATALACARELDADDRREIARFLRRAGCLADEDARALRAAGGAPAAGLHTPLPHPPQHGKEHGNE